MDIYNNYRDMIIIVITKVSTVEPLYSGHNWGMKFWPIAIEGWPYIRG